MAKKTTTKTRLRRPNGHENVVPTSQQLRALAAWWRLYEENGRTREPSVREVTAAMKLSDTAAQALLKQLDRKGIFLRELVQVEGPRKISDVGEKWLKMALALAS